MANVVEIVVKAKDQTQGVLSNITGSLGRIGSIAAGAALGGVAAVGAGLGTAAVAGLSFNSSMENVEAQLFAFLKDGEAVASTLDMIRERAAATPFAFQDMAEATAALIPAAKQSGESVEELIGLAEILAASNPAQGLDGAAFSIREALSGDFVSIVERFNLPRQRLKELKDEGVPAMEAISIAMQEMGLDASLVTNLSQTMTGRWSTLKDTFMNLAAEVTKPIFDKMSDSLGDLLGWVEDNQEAITRFTELAVGKIEDLIDTMGGIFAAFADGGIRAAIEETFNALGIPPETQAALTAVGETIANVFGWIIENRETIMSVLTGVAVGFAALSIISTVAGWITGLIAAWGAVTAVFAAASGPIAAIVALLGGPVTLVIVAVVAAVALLSAAWTGNWFGIRDKTLEVWNGFIKPIFGEIQTWVMGTLIPTLQALWAKWVDDVWPAIQTITENVWTVIKTIFTEIGRWINDNIVPWVQHFADKWRVKFGEAQTVLKTVWGVVLPILESLWDWFKTQIPNALSFLATKFSTELDIAQAAVEGLKGFIDDLWGALKGFWDWISGHTFKFKIDLPNLPDWATPGSPIPLHTAWKEFDRDLKTMSFSPRVNNAIPQLGAVDNSRKANITNVYNLQRLDTKTENEIQRRFATGGI